jgi:ATP/maltotriose-dependent transcriptional regulator MalT
MRGDFDQARELWAEADRLYESLHLSFRRAARSYIPAWIETLAGDYDAAERELRWGYETLEQMGEKSLRTTIAAFLAEALYRQGRDDEAERLTEVSEELAAADDLVTQVMWRSVRAKILAGRGEVEKAEELGHQAVQLADTTDFPELKAMTARDLAEALAAAGKTDAAQELVARAKEIYERKGNVVAAQQSGLRSVHPTRSGGENG